MLALSAIWTLIGVFLNKDWNGNSAGNKGVKIRIKSEFLHVKISFFSSLSVLPHSGFWKMCHIIYVFLLLNIFFLPVLNSLWHKCSVSQYEFPAFLIHITNNALIRPLRVAAALYHTFDRGAGTWTEIQSTKTLKICAYYKQYHKWIQADHKSEKYLYSGKCCREYSMCSNKAQTSNECADYDCTKQWEQMNLLWLCGGLLFPIHRNSRCC